MGLTGFMRRILGPGFPRLEGQEMPDPVDLGKTKSVVDPAKRIAVQGRVVKPKAARPTPSK
jgi:hypothetical protein